MITKSCERERPRVDNGPIAIKDRSAMNTQMLPHKIRPPVSGFYNAYFAGTRATKRIFYHLKEDQWYERDPETGLYSTCSNFGQDKDDSWCGQLRPFPKDH